MLAFTKMHGCANDYAVFLATDGADAGLWSAAERVESLARAVCDRRRGGGADGLVVVLDDGSGEADAEMRMHNPDGSYSAMCGNALRCVAKLMHDTRRLVGQARVRSGDTVVATRVVETDAAGRATLVEVDLGEPRLAGEKVPCTLAPTDEGRIVAAPLEAGGRRLEATVLSMGNPHCVLFADTLGAPAGAALPVATLGPEVERHPAFPERTNVEFVEVLARDRVRQRTWERGAGETLACGSGACAVVVAGVLTGRTDRRVTVELLGGELLVGWRETDGHVVMTGPAIEVFRGEWPYPASV